jgi:two-component system, NarL family, nitrate/nitrite response regulator NarL
MATIRIAVVDPQPIFIRGLQILLPAVSDSRLEVVAGTGDAGDAAGMVRRVRPDLAVVDLALPPPGGLRAIAAIHRTEPQVPVAAMSTTNRFELALEAVRAGASGFLAKTGQPEDLMPPLLALVEGWAVLPMPALAQLANHADRTRPCRRPALSEQDRRLWLLIAHGLSTSQLAGELHVSERTIKRLTASLLRRLRVDTRTQAAALAGRSGLLDPFPT